MSAKDIYEKLVETAMTYFWRGSHIMSHLSRAGKPGELIEKLSPDERKELQNLSSNDTQEARRDFVSYISGIYPESDTTIHTHSIKNTKD